jgi:hypothetical protein
MQFTDDFHDPQKEKTMGSRTDWEIETWQKAAGIEPATGERAEMLQRMSNAAFELIKVIQLEQSGIRDGDGCWHGSDVKGHTTDDLVALIQAYRDNDRITPVGNPSDSLGEDEIRF